MSAVEAVTEWVSRTSNVESVRAENPSTSNNWTLVRQGYKNYGVKNIFVLEPQHDVIKVGRASGSHLQIKGKDVSKILNFVKKYVIFAKLLFTIIS